MTLCSYHMSVRLPPDKLIWFETSNGLFTVRSAYKLAVNMLSHPNKGSSSDASNLRCFWRRIWSILVPHKICHFAWRACHNALPTKDNLLRRKIVQDGLCEECKEALESVYHVLWDCEKRRRQGSAPRWCFQHLEVHFCPS